MRLSVRQFLVPLSLIFTGITAWITYDLARSRSEAAFAAMVDDSRVHLLQRIDSVALALNGIAGFLDASSEEFGVDSWDRYVMALDLEKSMPQVAGIGLIRPVTAGTVGTLLDAAREEPAGELVIHPATIHPEKLVIRHIAPLAPNRAARGLDIGFETFRREAALAARDTGQTQLTGPLTLVQGDVGQIGFLVLRPRYVDGLPTTTPDQRRTAFLDWVYAPLFAGDALSGLTANQGSAFTMSIFDTARPDAAIFGPNEIAPADYLISDTLSVLGRTWEVHWSSTPAFEAGRRSFMVLIVVLAGLMVTTLLWAYHSAVERGDRRTSRQLQSNEDRNRAIFNNAVFGVIVLDADDRIVSANVAARSLFQRDDLRGARLCDLVEGVARSDDWSFVPATTTTAAGRTINLELQRNSWTDADGAARRTVILRDVTEATEAAEALRQSEERWNLALKGADIGVFDIDLTTKTSVVSETWKRLMQIDPDLPAGDMQRLFRSRIHPEDKATIDAADRACLLGLAPRSTSEFRIRLDNGTWRWFKSDAVVVDRDADGRALRMVGAQTDIQELRDAQVAVLAGEERLRLAQAHAPVGMAILDANGTLTDPNAALVGLTGIDARTLSRMQLSDLFDTADSKEIVASVIDLQGDPDRTFRKEVRLRRPDGAERWGHVKVNWAADPNGRDGEIYVMQINDITQEVKAQRVKSEFVATVSHELRTPLTSIKGALGLMAKAGDGAPNRLMTIAQSNVDRLIYLVNDILDFERISAGKLEFRLSPQEAEPLARQAIEQNAPYSDRFGVRMVVEDPAPGVRIMADPDRLAQVLSNLLSNACKHAPEGSDVTVRIENQGAQVRFCVTDHGPGVPNDFRDRIFQPFSQADSSDTRAKGGTGLGLNISRQMVEAMGGKLGFDSVPGRTDFWFTCPAPADQRPRRAQPAVSAGGPRTQVLHLEDDRDFAEIIRLSLQDFADVWTLHSVAEARDIIGSRDFDMIIVDWTLQDGDAEDLLVELTGAYPDARIVALSSTTREAANPAVTLNLTKSRMAVEDVARELRNATAAIAAE